MDSDNESVEGDIESSSETNDVVPGSHDEPKHDKAYKDDEELDDTIFIRNVARFDTTQESLKAHMEANWGETVYCLICKDKETGESKGTAFVKFKEPESAGMCLGDFEDREMQQKFFLDGRNLFVLPALNRNQMGEVKRASAKKTDDGPEKKKTKKPRWYRTAKKDDTDSGVQPRHKKLSDHQYDSKEKKQKKKLSKKKNLKPDQRPRTNQMAGDARKKRVHDAGRAPKRGRAHGAKIRKPGGRPHAKGSKKNKNSDKKFKKKTKAG